MAILTSWGSGSGQAGPVKDPCQSREEQVQVQAQESRLFPRWIVDRKAVE